MVSNLSSLGNLRILVIEDETLIAEELHDRLTELGCRIVGTIDSGELALRQLDELNPDLVFMDIRLKGSLDGIQTAEIIRQRKHLPIIFLTSHSDIETLNRAKQTNPVGYVLKPFHERDLMVAMEIGMHRYRSEKRLLQKEPNS